MKSLMEILEYMEFGEERLAMLKPTVVLRQEKFITKNSK